MSEDSSSICKMIRDYEYPILPGGQLQILNNGLCNISVRGDLGGRPTYSQPQIISLTQSVKSDYAQILSFQVGIKKLLVAKKP